MNLEEHHYDAARLLVIFCIILATAAMHVILSQTWDESPETGMILAYLIIAAAFTMLVYALRQMDMICRRHRI